MNRRLEATLRDVWDGIRTQPGRVGLSFMAIAVGIASLTVLVAVLGGLRDKSRQIVRELGANVVGILQHGGSGGAGGRGLEERHAALLTQNLPESTVSTVSVLEVPTLGTRELLSVVATDSALIDIRQWKLVDGRFLDPWDLENRERNAVVSRTLGRLWGWKVGDIVMLRNAPFEIVGIVEIGGGVLDTEVGDSSLILGERVVFVPRTVAPYWKTGQRTPPPTLVARYRAPGNVTPEPAVDAIFLQAPNSASYSQVVAKAQRLLSQPDYHVKHTSWVTPDSLIEGVERLERTISLTVGSIAVLCLVLGGTTLMSLMIANVKERVAEIGLRRALGASPREIAALFVLEACLVTGGAAVAATSTTCVALAFLRETFPVPLRLGSATVLTPLAVAFVLGVVFAYWPARSAATIMPSEALRNE